MKNKKLALKPRVEDAQRLGIGNALPRCAKLRRKREDDLEGWKLSIFPLTTAEVLLLTTILRSMGIK